MQAPTPRVVRLWRLARLGFHILRGVLTAGLILPWCTPRLRSALIGEWARSLLGLLAVRVTVQGAPPDGASRNLMVVANHVSWLDIYLLNAVRPVRFVSKSEVRSWPVIGWLAAKTGTLFLEREKRRDTARINDAVAAALSGGDRVAFFPEGTTTDGTHLWPFRSPLLQAAVKADSTVIPAALRYLQPDGSPDPAPAYFGNMTMGESLANILARREIRAELFYLEPIPCLGKRRHELAEQAEKAISNALNQAVLHRTPETGDGPQGAAR